MEPELPQWHRRATLVDLLDRVLERGVFLRADLVVSVADIPLLGASLSLSLAGAQTMLEYGYLSDWDRGIRSAAGGRSTTAAGGSETTPSEEETKA